MKKIHIVTGLFLLSLFQYAFAQQRRTDANVVGHVVCQGEHIPFANVAVKGTTIGTVTDETGHFQLINLPLGEKTIAVSVIGYKPREMLQFFKETPLFHINKFAIGKPGFIDTDKFYRDFNKYFPEDDFSGLSKKLFVTAVDMLSGEKTVFDQGPLIKTLLASSAFPGLFSPVEFNETLYSDGGILDNFPTDPVRKSTSVLIGSYASPLDAIQPESLKYSVNVLERAIRINYSRRSLRKFAHCNLVFRPLGLSRFGLLDVGKLDEIYQIGYQTASELLRSEDLKHLSA